MGRFAELSLVGKAGAVVAAIAVAGAAGGVSLAAASSSNGSGNGIGQGAPPQPVLATTSLPANPTNAATANFTYTDSRPQVNFFCSLDAAAFSSCPASGIAYSSLGTGPHTFRVEARSGNGNSPLSTPAGYSWVVANQTFPISGNLSTPLAPGVPAQSLNLSITNPYSFTMKVTAITVSVSSTSNNTNCGATDNFRSTNYSGTGFTVGPGVTETMTAAGVPAAQLPTIQMLDLPSNQDACHGVTLSLVYGGTVTTP